LFRPCARRNRDRDGCSLSSSEVVFDIRLPLCWKSCRMEYDSYAGGGASSNVWIGGRMVGCASASRRDGKTKEMDGPLDEGPLDRACSWAGCSACRKIGRRLVTTPEMGRMGVVLMALGLGGLIAESEGVRRGAPTSS
jgi:hypothetical protein